MEKEKFAQLVWSARDTMYRVAKTILSSDADCEDAVSQAIVNAFSNLSKLKRDEYAKTWLLRIEIHECYRIYRERKQERSYEEYKGGAENCSVDGYCGDTDYSELYLAMQELPREMRIALVLYYQDGYSIQEIAEIQRTTKGNVKSRLSRGRQKLRTILTREKGGQAYEGY